MHDGKMHSSDFRGGLFTVVIPVSDQTAVQGWVIVSSQCF